MKALVGILLAIVLPACGSGELLQRVDFQKLWCGERLCRWTVDAGAIRRVTTWHELDPEVGLAGPIVRLSRIDAIPHGTKLCAVIAVNVGELSDNRVRLEVDLADDGAVELSQPLERGGNETYSEGEPFAERFPELYPVWPIAGTPGPATSARVSLVKEGPSEVVIRPLHVNLRACQPLPADAGP